MKRVFYSLILTGFFMAQARAFAWTTTLKPAKFVQLSYRTQTKAPAKHSGKKHRKKKQAKTDGSQPPVSKP